MIVVIEVLASSNGWTADVPTWIKSADVEAFDGRGDTELTTDVSQALRFPDVPSAFEFWRKQSEKRPLREDGEPNRPLTALTVSVGPPEE